MSDETPFDDFFDPDFKEFEGDFEDIPEQPPLPPPGRGPGLPRGDIPQLKSPDLEDRDFAVLGYRILPSDYDNTGGGGDDDNGGGKGEYAVVYLMLANRDKYRWNTSSKAVMRVLEERHKNNQIPFKTKLVKVKSKKSRYSYYNLV